ncbi:MAG: hypothetical protein ACI8U4_003217 [Natronomonas sp.]|jgi:hypothetical protein
MNLAAKTGLFVLTVLVVASVLLAITYLGMALS